MSCTNCSSNPNTFSVQYFYSRCVQCSTECATTVPAQCLYYAGPNLSCSGVNTNDSLEVALQKIDEQICSAIGDYSTYQFHCVSAWFGETITQESQFVDAITGYACDIRTDVDTFIDETFVTYQTSVTNNFNSITSPSITCASASVGSSDTLTQVLNKYCNKFAAIDTFNSLSGVTWSSCYTVGSTPTTLATAFNALISQICQTKALATGSSLPTFNNTGSCLTGGTSSDSLVTTIGLIKTRLCLSNVYSGENITWGCLDDTTGLEAGVQNIVDQVNTMTQSFPTFNNADFTVEATDSGDPCSGVTVSLATPSVQDRFVASDSSDASPGTLADKVTAGTNITLDFSSTPGQMIINGSGTADSYTVKANTLDTTPDFLDAKVNGGSDDSGITITTQYNSSTEQVDIIPSIGGDTFLGFIFDVVESNPELLARWCAINASCPSPCSAPTNVQATQLTTTTTLAP